MQHSMRRSQSVCRVGHATGPRTNDALSSTASWHVANPPSQPLCARSSRAQMSDVGAPPQLRTSDRIRRQSMGQATTAAETALSFTPFDAVQVTEEAWLRGTGVRRKLAAPTVEAVVWALFSMATSPERLLLKADPVSTGCAVETAFTRAFYACVRAAEGSEVPSNRPRHGAAFGGPVPTPVRPDVSCGRIHLLTDVISRIAPAVDKVVGAVQTQQWCCVGTETPQVAKKLAAEMLEEQRPSCAAAWYREGTATSLARFSACEVLVGGGCVHICGIHVCSFVVHHDTRTKPPRKHLSIILVRPMARDFPAPGNHAPPGCIQPCVWTTRMTKDTLPLSLVQTWLEPLLPAADDQNPLKIMVERLVFPSRFAMPKPSPYSLLGTSVRVSPAARAHNDENAPDDSLHTGASAGREALQGSSDESSDASGEDEDEVVQGPAHAARPQHPHGDVRYDVLHPERGADHEVLLAVRRHHITELCLSAAPIAHPTQPLTMLITFARAALTRWTCKVRTEFKRAKQPHTRSRPHSPSGEQWPQPPRLWVYASNALITSSSTEPGARRRRRRACVLPSRTLFLRWPLVHSTSTDLACAPSACAVHLCPGRRVPHRATQHLVCCACHRGLHPV